MWKRPFSVVAATIGVALISASTQAASNLYPSYLASATTSVAAGAIGGTTPVPTASLDVEQDCGTGGVTLNQLNASTRVQICSELTQMREILQRLRARIASLRQSIVSKERRFQHMERLAIESTNRVRELSQELMSMDKEREQLKYFLTDFKLNAVD